MGELVEQRRLGKLRPGNRVVGQAEAMQRDGRGSHNIVSFVNGLDANTVRSSCAESEWKVRESVVVLKQQNARG